MKYDEDFLGGWDEPVAGQRVEAPAPAPAPEPAGAVELVDDEEQQLDSSGEAESPAPDEEDGEQLGNVVLPDHFEPADSADRPIDSSMRTRYHGHGEFNDLLRADWIAAIELDPDAFDALLYRATRHQPDANDQPSTPQVAEVFDPNQALLDYQHPEKVAVLDCPDEMESFMGMYDGSDNTGAGVDALILRTSGLNVPVGSVFEWQEQLTGDRYRRVWWYVHRIFNYGTANVGSLFYCIPFRSQEL